MKTLKLKRNEARRVLRGHPWIFNNELQPFKGAIIPGEIVDVVDFSNRFVGRGYMNPHTLIAIRLLTTHQEEIDFAFLKKKITAAHRLRSQLGFGESFRAFFSEGDGLPGLIVDKYEDTLVIQSLTAGIDTLMQDIILALQEEYSPHAILLRNDTAARGIEGLPQEKKVFGEISEPVEIEESGIRYKVDLLEGQKTGFFFDQRENRLALREYVVDKRTLDCFCYVGSWSLSAARFGALDVLGIDSSERAIALAAQNAALNGLPVKFKKADVFNELRSLEQTKERFGCIILDPPAFVKNRTKIRAGLKGYKEINVQAMKLLDPGGILVSCSCSHHVNEELFREMLVDSAYSAGRQARLVEMRTQARDHPILLAARETQYLKCAILKIE
ncbi:MAG: class I SAM-dependent rRNA methyltransferase [Nitrospirota bacterium]